MENKKGVYTNSGNTPTNDVSTNEAIPKHIHNIAPQHLRLLQYGLKIPNQPSLHQHQSRPVTPHIHQHQPQSIYLQNSLHQHQANIYQNPIHQQNQISPQNHFHNQAQIWSPHQPPAHYHPQQQQQYKSEPQTQPLQTNKPKEIDRRKLTTNNQHLRSPSAKRPLEAAVTIQGWLHKQGSDGLMLWKKRWFVLSEYCLFYYKGSEEEKLLGSILLPSYKVSVCCPDDKINRKYAFKCEHLNMRTYILAADSQELMMQWVRHLNMACLLQNNETENPIIQISSSGTVQSQNSRNTPTHVHSYSNTTDLSNPSQHELSQYNQPLYANAPPKPRRLTEGYSSPSWEILDRHSNEPKYIQHSQYNLQPMYMARNVTKSPINIYGNPQAHLEYLQTSPQQPIYNKHVHLPDFNMANGRDNQNAERRTPDTYGRSKLHLSKGHHPSDYEDVYADQQSMYKRPLSPVAYTNNNRLVASGGRPYTPVTMRSSKDNLSYVPLQQLKKFPNTIPRPHSADFLEYEVKHQLPNVITRQPRPKSSLDINRHTPSDNYFYTEERYAEKMRKSAQYLPKISKYSDDQQKRPSSSIKYEPETTYPISRVNTHFNDYRQMDLHPVRSRSVLSDGSLSKELDVDLQTSPRDNSIHNRQDIYLYNEDGRKFPREYDQFTRSASARLAQTSGQYEGRPGSRDGERKREESMKRLLEWKQRMLQSPLNRKVNQGLHKNSAGKFNPYYRTSENGYVHNTPNLEIYSDGRRSNVLPQYNSYSSDDEEKEDGSKENVQTQAGRITDIIPSISNLALTSSTTVLNLAPTISKNRQVISLITVPSPTETVNKLPVVCTKMDSSQKAKKEADKNIFEKPLKIATNNSTHTALVSSLRSEFANKFEQKSTAELKSSVASVKNILGNDNEALQSSVIEENYMTMNKSVLESMSLDLEIDENPYVEMTQGSVISLLNPNESDLCNEMQAYEAICFSNGKSEPLYMELNQLGGKNKLPDILMASQDQKGEDKSDSSDADDEASKDLDTPCHPRFSLSDTFRPASYYLGASRVAPELQDSSDSELVSPPPIPITPPPLDESEESRFKNDSLSLYSNNSEIENHDSDVELRLSNRSSYERMLKRRPFSDEFFDLDERNKSHDYENMYIDGSDSFSHSRDDSRDTISSINTLKSTSSRRSMLTPKDFILRDRPDSCTSIGGDVSGFLSSSSPRLTPTIGGSENIQEITFYSDKSEQISLDMFTNQSAPYYYSDLSINTSRTDSNSSILTLNNQRSATNGSKRDISHIVNPIRCNKYPRNSVRTHRNLLDTNCKLAAEARSASVDFLNIADKSDNIDKKNIYESDTLKRMKTGEIVNLCPGNKSDKFSCRSDPTVRRSYSLEGLLENVFNESVSTPQNRPIESVTTEGSHLWEEDSIWHERLRSASQRHTKSLDDLDCIREFQNKPKKQRGITRLVTYVNDNMFNMPVQNKQEVGKERGNFIIDREKLRQWDFLSSAPSDAQFIRSPAEGCINSVVDSGAGLNACEPSEQNSTQSPASGSISITTRDTFPHSMVSKKVWTPSIRAVQSKSTSNLARGFENDYVARSPQGYMMSQGPSQQDLSSDTSQSSIPRRAGNWISNDKMNVSAGELLGRTHEELVLLLIQLRRQSANNFNAIETCYNEIDNIQSKLPKMDATKRLENLQKLEQIKQHLLELEKQYEKGKPLVNLVDNMVKLGSLYRFPKDQNNYPYVKDRIEFNQQIQERRLLAEERRDWNRFNPSHSELQAKVQQLYQLDHLIQEESETLQGLQHDKEEIERALGGLRHRLIKGFKDPAEVEQARKQQIVLENELTRVHSMLSQNSRKLEETVAGNARLEQELLVLKQKLQISRQHRSSPQISNAGDSLPCVIGTSAMLESDLHRVQQKVGDLQRQRQELSMQVRQLTDRSNNLQQLRLASSLPTQFVANKKKIVSSWRETDLDTMSIIDHGESWDNSNASLISSSPMYTKQELYVKSEPVAEDFFQTSTPQEKQEIKTVRIVKRESERRQRDREKTVTGKWDAVIEEDDSCQKSLLFRLPVQKTQTNLETTDLDNSNSVSLSNPSLPDVSPPNENIDATLDKSPIFKSEAARQIMIEMSSTPEPKKTNRRAVPKEKRRHHTAPHNNLIMKSLNQLPTTDKDFEKLDVRRARDDLDMERALRQRIDAPDVVRSTLSSKELKYNESTIDNLLGTPNKIIIPERYVPEQLPQLSVEEQQYRLRKVESIKKMLSDTTIISGSSVNLASDEAPSEDVLNSLANKTTTKIMEEKKQREHLLQLNQILAKQVMEMSKIVAVKALASLPLESNKLSSDEDDLSPGTPLPIYQQRDNFYS